MTMKQKNTNEIIVKIGMTTESTKIEYLRKLSENIISVAFGERTFTRHTNKNGDVGGFVESTAHVSNNAYIDKNVLILNNAWILNNTRISGNVLIRGNVWVLNGASVSGQVHLSGNAVVSAGMQLSGKMKFTSGVLWLNGHTINTKRQLNTCLKAQRLLLRT